MLDAAAPDNPVFLIDSTYQAMRMEQDSGSIEVGKFADIIVLDRDLFDLAPEQISDTQVVETVFEGRVVSSRRVLQSGGTWKDL